MYPIRLGLRIASPAETPHPAPQRARRAACHHRARRSLRLGVALAILCAAGLAAPRAEASEFVPTLRTELGFAKRYQPGGTQTAFTLNIEGGGGLFLGGPVLLGAELGYTYTHQHTHAFTAGLGLGTGTPIAVAGYLLPRLVVGIDDGRAAIGLRTGLGAAFLLGIFTVEASHQFLHVGTGLEHEMRLVFGINGGTLLAIIKK